MRQGQQVRIPVFRKPDLVFDFGAGQVEGVDSQGQLARLSLVALDRFEIDRVLSAELT